MGIDSNKHNEDLRDLKINLINDADLIYIW